MAVRELPPLPPLGADMLAPHERAALHFSGGKDSLALLYLARPHLDRITVLFADPGGVFPHVTSFVIRTCEQLGARLQIVRPPLPVDQYHEQFGLPADVLPVWATPEMAPYMRDPAPQLLQAPMRCCGTMLLAPLERATLAGGWKIVLRGAKLADERRGVAHGYVDQQGIEYRQPLWEWGDREVYWYLREQGAELPRQYAEGVPDSLDCWLCTAHLATHYGRRKLAWMRAHTPELWAQLQPRLARMRVAVGAAVDQLEHAIGER